MITVTTKKSVTDAWSSQGAAREVLDLADEREEIRRRIRDIEHCINTSPERHVTLNESDIQDMPPPEEHRSELFRHPVSALTSSRPLMRRQAAAQLTQRRKHMLVFIISALLFSVFIGWVSRSL